MFNVLETRVAAPLVPDVVSVIEEDDDKTPLGLRDRPAPSVISSAAPVPELYLPKRVWYVSPVTS